MIFLVYARYDSFIGFSLLPLMFVLLSIAEFDSSLCLFKYPSYEQTYTSSDFFEKLEDSLRSKHLAFFIPYLESNKLIFFS